ncbi:MAG: penicillin-binding protein 2 [Marinilabiliales bacterium]|nr:MAG: penicillin-binding protein 2 [Marinilabiliales bacterium]
MDSFANRRHIIRFVIILVGLIYIIRLFLLQVVDNTYKVTASSNVLRYVTQFPARGLIYDREGRLLVYNEAAYDLMLVPQQLEAFDTAEFCDILNVSKEYIDENIKRAKDYSHYNSSIFLKQVSSITYANLQEKLYKYPGFYVQARTLRKYTNENGAHLLGYVGEVNDKIIEKDDYYKSGDYIGISGIEQSYEEYLRGEKGVNVYLVDVHNRIKGTYSNGRLDKKAEVGSNIISTIDVDLQSYGEKLMNNKIGSIVAIEPSTGEILALVSAPTYNPELLVGRIRTKNYVNLMSDTLKPLFNRALMAQYPPGSTFKIINGLIGLQEKVLWTSTEHDCAGAYYSGRMRVGCHIHRSPLDFIESIQMSCNTYYCNVFRSILDNKKYPTIRESFDQWREYVMSFGFGQYLNSDFSNELKGLVPTKQTYDRVYGEKGWRSLTLVSMAIGQGELGTTPLQMANMTAAIANRGYYYTPHIVKEIEGDYSLDDRFYQKNYTKIDSNYFNIVIEGMDLAVNGEPGSGSTARTAHLEDVVVCGKTGTAENPHGEDHSIFIAFAPKDDPKIAIAVYIENGGFGGTWAAPTAKLMIEKYLNDSISVPWWEQYVLNAEINYNAETDKPLE